MKRRRLLKRLNAATLELSAPGIWLLDETFASTLRKAMEDAWRERDGNPASLAARLGQSDWSTADELLQIVDGIGVVSIAGMLFPRANPWTYYGLATAVSDVVAAVDEALANRDVRGVLFVIDSPGGRAQGVFEAVRQIRGMADAAGKPIWAMVEGIAASGGYAFAVAADRILSTNMSVTGSIGALMIHAQFRPEDTAYTVVRYGENKALGNPYEPFTEQVAADWQAAVNAIGVEFETVVAEGRNVTIEQVQSRMGRGATFFAAEARQRGLIDGIVGSADEALGLLRQAVGLSTPAPAPPPGRRVHHAASASAAAEAGHNHLSAGGVAASGVQLTGAEILTAAASPPAGGVRVNHGSGAVAAASATQQEQGMNPKLKAALFARGLIAAIDAADDLCRAALAAYCAGCGVSVPPNDDEALTLVMAPRAIAVSAAPLQPIAGAQPAAASGQAAPVAAAASNPAQVAHDREVSEARAAARADEVARVRELRSRGGLLGVDATRIDAAIAAGTSVADALVQWTGQQAAANPPLQVNVVGETGAAAFERDALDALSIRCGIGVQNPSVQAQRWGRGGVRMDYLARQSLQLQGVRVSDISDSEDVARAALRAGVQTHSEVLIDDAGALNRPASFPNLLSGLANRLLDAGVARANASYQEWTGVVPAGLPDLKAVPVISKSTVYALDEVIDDEKVSELGLAEEVLSSIQVRRFKNKFGWTPVMVANDDLGAFAEGMLGFGAAAEGTVNLLCVGLLTGNAYLLDGYQLFDNSNHGNYISSGAAPSAAQWEAMDLKVAAQRPVGGKGYIREQMQVLLCPPQLRVAALQVLAPFGQVPELKNPTTDATLNVYRGTGKVVVEPELQGSSAAIWYGLCDPTRAPTVVRVYQRGWGEGPRRTAWVDPETGTAWTAYEVRVGVAVKNYRTAVKNAGA